MVVLADCGCSAGSANNFSVFPCIPCIPWLVLMLTTEYTEYTENTERKTMNNALERINQASTSEADSMFEDCCGSATWASMMTMMRPFASEDELIQIASAVWNDQEILQTKDWLEAFAAHPKIGETKAAKSQFAEWSAGEQAGMNSADDRQKEELAQANREYFEKFGFIFIVCATGKTAGEMLELCRTRLGNDRETEIRIAAAEQEKITEIRLRKLCRAKLDS